jgi:hypothetical protein
MKPGDLVIVKKRATIWTQVREMIIDEEPEEDVLGLYLFDEQNAYVCLLIGHNVRWVYSGWLKHPANLIQPLSRSDEASTGTMP